MGERDRGAVQKKEGKKSRGINSKTEREGAREEQHSGYGFHHSEGCWLGVGEWEASSPLWCYSCGHVVSPRLNLQNSRRKER